MLGYFLKQKPKGFTLIEVIFTILIISIALVGTFSLLTQTMAITTDISLTLTAAYLGQEGIEIVRNFRDRNWLEQRAGFTITWDDGLQEGSWEVDYNDNSLSTFTGRFLRIDPNGFYNYERGTETRFKRKIEIFDKEDFDQDGTNDMLKVRVHVIWQERGKEKKIVVQENLYNWLK